MDQKRPFVHQALSGSSCSTLTLVFYKLGSIGSTPQSVNLSPLVMLPAQAAPSPTLPEAKKRSTRYDSPMHSIPPNLDLLHQHEEFIRAESLALVTADEALSDHLQAVHDALDHMRNLLQVKSAPDTDRHTVQLVAIRLFNIGATSLKVGLSGYYQQGFQLLRDSLETVNLLDLFRADQAKIGEWRVADNKKLKKDFGPAAVRQALDGFPTYAGQKAGRARAYAQFSEYAAHATHRGFTLIAPSTIPKLGPFLDAQFLRALLEDIGRHLAHTTIALSDLIHDNDDGSMVLLAAKAEYLERLRQYHDKYIKK